MTIEILDFFKISDIHIWQHVFLVSFIIPLVLYFRKQIQKWYLHTRPINLLLKGYKQAELEVLIFLSQLSGALPTYERNLTQKYVASYPEPLPTNQGNLGYDRFQNIDLVWTEADGRCAADVFNILGRGSITKNIRIADTIIDWNKRDNPIFTIGFNPKTKNLIRTCAPIWFEISDPRFLQIEGHNLRLDAILPNDAGIIQKTFIRNSSIPVIILAGLGANGTETAGYFFNQNFVHLGKLYGNRPFCVLIKTDTSQSRNYYEVKAIYPRPPFLRMVLYPITSFRWSRKKIFPSINLPRPT
jgi:hypothetical protein